MHVSDQLQALASLFHGKEPQVPIDRRSERRDKKESLCPCRESNPGYFTDQATLALVNVHDVLDDNFGLTS